MALIKCPECGKEISDMADSCPNCGFNIKKYIESLKAEEKQKELEKKRDEQKEREHQEAIKREEKKKELHNKYFGTPQKKRKSLAIIIASVLVVILGACSYFISTKDIREIKKETGSCIEHLGELDEKIYSFDLNDSNAKLYATRAVLSMRVAENSIGKIREKYSKLKESDKTKYDTYLQSKYNVSWNELDDKYNSYGLKAETLRSSLDNDESHYVELLVELKNEYKNEHGEVAVTESHAKLEDDCCIVTGSVTNTTDRAVYFVKVKIALYDENGSVINTDNTYACGDEGLKPGESSSFICYVDNPQKATRFKAEVYDYDY